MGRAFAIALLISSIVLFTGGLIAGVSLLLWLFLGPIVAVIATIILVIFFTIFFTVLADSV